MMLDILLSRRSIRKFQAAPVSAQDITDILHAAMQAPSAGNEQAWQFVILQGDTLEQYLNLNRNTPKGAPIGILVCADLSAQKYEGYAVQDCAAATENILLAAHEKGLGSVWTAVFPTAVADVNALLGLPEHVVPFACIPIGYADGTAQMPPSRYDAAKVHHNAW